MGKKKASEIFGPVDSELTVIDRGRRGKKTTKTLAEAAAPSLGPYKRQPITEEEWEKAAVNCPKCGNPTTRLLPYGFTGKRKACPTCIANRVKLLEHRARIITPRLRRRKYRGMP